MKIHLASPNYILRTLEPADAAQDWGAWTAEPHAVRMLNMRPQHLGEEQRRAYIASFDGDERHALGMFTKAEGRLVGLTTLHIDKERREFLINVLTGDPGDRGKGAPKPVSCSTTICSRNSASCACIARRWRTTRPT